MFGVLDPQGPIASQERSVIVIAILLMLIVAVPLLITLYTIAWKYRAGSKNATHEPNRVGGLWKQLIWWAIPAVIITFIAVLNWQSTHALDPSKPLNSAVKPLTIQVVALQWKWLFIYPEQNIATVNFIQFPVGTPVHFELTADAPMSSLWIPQLGGQMYAMSGMVTQLNLMASAPGDFAGKDTEINGDGYAGMNFIARASSQSDFDAWVASIKAASATLDQATYDALAVPSQNARLSSYSSLDKELYNGIIMKYMPPATTTGTSETSMPAMPANMPGMSI